jgi:hypothetical protein
MASQKRVLYFTEEQYHLLINALNDLRTKCLNEGINTIDVDTLLLQVIDSPVKGFMKEVRNESR